MSLAFATIIFVTIKYNVAIVMPDVDILDSRHIGTVFVFLIIGIVFVSKKKFTAWRKIFCTIWGHAEERYSGSSLFI